MILKDIRNFFLIGAFFALTVPHLSSQITIGAALPPNSGAILDLKEFAPDAQNATSTKGLQLPRVSLTNPSSLVDIAMTDSDLLDPVSVTGLWVYNVNETSITCPGVHIWDGSRWASMTPGVVEYYEDVRTKADGSKERATYGARTFGTAGTWMLENLRATTYADNLGVDKTTDDIKVVMPDGSYTLKAAYYPNADKAVFDQNPGFGMLYTFAAVTNGKTITFNETESHIYSGSANPTPGNVELVGGQGVCPEGWHVPSDKEWNDLEEVIANEQTGLYTINNVKSNKWNSDGINWRWVFGSARSSETLGHGRNMKSAFVKVNNQPISGASASYCNGGLNILMVGVVTSTGPNSFGATTIYWSSSSSTPTNAMVRNISPTRHTVGRTEGPRTYALPVRCKKN